MCLNDHLHSLIWKLYHSLEEEKKKTFLFLNFLPFCPEKIVMLFKPIDNH